MRVKGLEPPRLSAPDPKSGAATNYAIPALFYKKCLLSGTNIGVFPDEVKSQKESGAQLISPFLVKIRIVAH